MVKKILTGLEKEWRISVRLSRKTWSPNKKEPVRDEEHNK